MLFVVLGFLTVFPGTVMARAPVVSAQVLASYPHDPAASTQGLVFYKDLFVESTGEYGHSTIRIVHPETGQVLRRTDLHPDHFGEGTTIMDGKAYVLTWLSGDGYVFDVSDCREAWPDLVQVGSFAIPVRGGATEAWGLTSDDHNLIMSNGSDALIWLDPQTFEVVRILFVHDGSKPIQRLNELEWVNGLIFANVWKKKHIAVIDPSNGTVLMWIDLHPLMTPENKRAGVPNGIAHDRGQNRLYVTGKLWDTVFEIRVPALPLAK